LTVRCGPSLSDVLSDLCDPLTLLFPDRSAANLAALYRSSPQARVFNTLLGEGIRQGLAERRGNAPLRVLEIGGGTGGSTPYVLEALPDNTAEYLFTDISPRFTLRAEELFGDYSFFRTEVLDIERDPDTQGFALHSFDLIVAANVLHATADLRETMAHVRQLLAPAGLLAMVETTEPDRWIDLSFGLLDGWWRFRDFDLRPNHTLLTGPRWVSLLGEIGFGDAVAVGTPVENLLFARASEATPEGRWLVLGDCQGTGQRLADELRAGGADCVLADAATSLKTAGFDRVVDLRALDASVAEDVLVDATAMTAATTMTAVSLVNQLASQPDKPPRLWLVTRGAQAVESNRAIALWQTPLWGLGRAIALEQPDLRCARIDLDPEGGLDGLVEELVHPDEEDQIAWRGGVRYVTRLVRSREATPADEQTRLEQIKPGELDGLEFRSASRAMPATREVEIRVLFSALNFKDVLRALGHFPENTVPLGSECAGIVERVGEGVTEFAPGDRVMAVAAGAFGNFVTVASCFTAHCPSNLSLAAAATLPIAFLTARYALECIGGMKAGDRVLIHAAAGGVGLAALQLARRTGAEIFATAGSEAKRQWVRSLGAAHVFSSREQGFAEEIARLTGGRGVDLVLNSLAGEFVTAGLKTVVPGGLFLEIGKAGVLELERVRALRPDIRYEVLDWGELAESDPAEVERMLRTIAVEAQTGEIKPLPFEVYEREEIESAFRTMAQGRHRGKLIVRQAARRNEITASGAYLITGGLGGLGLCVAEWLAVHGARHLVLVGRSEPGAEAKAVIDRLHSSGAVVWVRRADVRQREEIASVIAELDATGVQLAGIVHSAGVLDDGLLAQQNEARMERVLGPKVGGAWHLDELSRGRDLGMFVLFSSLASVVGSAGQANHAAANAFLDGLARWRRARGEVAVSIQWGAWSEMGSATGAELRRRRETKGIGEMRPAQGLALFEEILRRDRVEVAAGPVDWARFAREGAGGRAPWLAELVAAGERGRADRNAARTDTADLMRRVEEAPEGQRKEFLTAHVRAEAARILGMDSQRVDSRRPLSELGLDSLMSVELRNALSAAAGTPLPATLLYNYPSVQDIALHLYELLFASASDGTGEVSQDAEGANLLGSIENMSDDDVERLLAQEMGEAR
jgi:NADPH:quinone reductase-like Zn-dependent oxidoreductase/SAM-dependent methyltransferase/acyl carrier protein